VRDHVEDEANNALVFTRCDISGDFRGIKRGDVDVHAGARLNNVDHDQTDQQGDSRNDFEVQQRVAASLADRLHVLHTSDTADHSAEDDWGNDHFDQFDEPVAQRLEGLAGIRIEVTDQNADHDCYDHLEVQGFIQGLTSRHVEVLKSVVASSN